MNWLEYYQKMKYEVDILETRLKVIKQYEKNLVDERSKIENTIYLQKTLLNEIELELNSSHRIEFKLFRKIVIEGLNVTKAIEKVSLEESKDISTIWKYYYPRVREKISKLQTVKNELEGEKI